MHYHIVPLAIGWKMTEQPSPDVTTHLITRTNITTFGWLIHRSHDYINGFRESKERQHSHPLPTLGILSFHTKPL
jgi:hypothetical protein